MVLWNFGPQSVRTQFGGNFWWLAIGVPLEFWLPERSNPILDQLVGVPLKFWLLERSNPILICGFYAELSEGVDPSNGSQIRSIRFGRLRVRSSFSLNNRAEIEAICVVWIA